MLPLVSLIVLFKLSGECSGFSVSSSQMNINMTCLSYDNVDNNVQQVHLFFSLVSVWPTSLYFHLVVGVKLLSFKASRTRFLFPCLKGGLTLRQNMIFNLAMSGEGLLYWINLFLYIRNKLKGRKTLWGIWAEKLQRPQNAMWMRVRNPVKLRTSLVVSAMFLLA